MRRYRFRLEPVLRVRRIEQDTAQARLAAATSSLDVADGRLRRSMDRYHALPGPQGPQPATAWLSGRTGAGLTAATVVAAGLDRVQAATRLDEQRDGLQDARRRVSALERLDERRRQEHALAARRHEDAVTDELVTARHGRTS